MQELAAEPEPNYLHWMLAADFPPEVIEIARDALRGNFPRRPFEGVMRVFPSCSEESTL